MFTKDKPGRGRPKGTFTKRVFSLPAFISNTFPAHISVLEAKSRQMDTQRASPGRDILKKYYSGETITLKQAVIAQCCECMGFYGDGKTDCENPTCSLYPFMPYRRKDAHAFQTNTAPIIIGRPDR